MASRAHGRPRGRRVGDIEALLHAVERFSTEHAAIAALNELARIVGSA